jgi:capsule biosynthesis phosphatase
MIIIIPLGGIGQRFKEVGYDLPKPLIKAQGKEIIFWLLESLKIKNFNKIKIYIVYNNNLTNYDFEKRISTKFPYINFYRLNKNTNGPIETVYELVEKIYKENINEKVLFLDGDIFFKINIIKISQDLTVNTIFYKKDFNKNPRFSYIKLNKNNLITAIKEKVKISNNANIGAYFFNNLGELNILLKKAIKKKCKYISEIYNLSIKEGKVSKGYEVRNKDFEEIGTPESLKKFSINNPQKKRRFCFDLDQTLVSSPKIIGNYNTVEPMHENIKFLKFLRDNGHYIIIYTARRMKTHHGDLKKVINEIKNMTIQQLKRFNIPYDELIFGKPYADYYIDDLAINAYENLQFKLGFYYNDYFVRKFNNITIGEKFTLKKSSNTKKIKNEINYYKKIPPRKKSFFPLLKDYGLNWYKISTIHTTNLSYLYLNQLITKKHFDLILNLISEFHNSKVPNNGKINIYSNYIIKLNSRLRKIKNKFVVKHSEQIKILKNKLKEYQDYQLGRASIVHGDLVFSNIFFDLKKDLKLIDPRGEDNKNYTCYGDLFYDYAKIYQSLTGYEHILSGKKNFYNLYYQNLKKNFEEYFLDKFGKKQFYYLKYLTASLYLTLIPMHDENNTDLFFMKFRELTS